MILALQILVMSSLFVAYERFQKRANIVDLTVATGLLNAQLILIQLSIAGIQFRLIMFFLGLIYCSYKLSTNRNKHSFSGIKKLTYFWIIFSFTILFSKIINGSYSLSSETIIDFVSRYGFALLCLWVFAFASITSAVSIARWLFLICLINLLFAVLQFLGIGAAFDLQRSLYPDTTAYGDDLIAQGLNSTFGYIPGLSSFSITTGYIFSVLAWLGVSFATLPPRPLQAKGWTGLAFLICAVGGSIILSRSTVLSGLFGLIVLFLLPLVLRERSANQTGAIATVLLGGVGFFVVQQLAESYVNGGDRLLQLGEETRSTLWQQSFSLFLENPLFGAPYSVRYKAGVDIGAHNVLLNALVQGGLITLIGLVVFLSCAARVSLSCVRRTHGTFRNLSNALFCAQMIYSLKSMFHNESVFTSGILFMMISGIIIGLPNHQPFRLRKQRLRPAPRFTSESMR